MDMYDAKKNRIAWNSIFAMILYAVLISILMILVYAGARIYRSEDSDRQRASHIRKTTAYIENKLMEGDSAGGISVIKKEDKVSFGSDETDANGSADNDCRITGDALKIKEEDSNYATLIYLYDGKLCEELTRTGNGYDPKRASIICEADSFTVSEENGIITTVIDGNKSVYAIRSEKGTEK
jgi:hypothetical protein